MKNPIKKSWEMFKKTSIYLLASKNYAISVHSVISKDSSSLKSFYSET